MVAATGVVSLRASSIDRTTQNGVRSAHRALAAQRIAGLGRGPSVTGQIDPRRLLRHKTDPKNVGPAPSAKPQLGQGTLGRFDVPSMAGQPKLRTLRNEGSLH